MVWIEVDFPIQVAMGKPVVYLNWIKKGYKMEVGEILDITPTILYLFGEPITDDMDGKVLLNIFELDFKKIDKL